MMSEEWRKRLQWILKNYDFILDTYFFKNNFKNYTCLCLCWGFCCCCIGKSCIHSLIRLVRRFLRIIVLFKLNHNHEVYLKFTTINAQCLHLKKIWVNSMNKYNKKLFLRSKVKKKSRHFFHWSQSAGLLFYKVYQ